MVLIRLITTEELYNQDRSRSWPESICFGNLRVKHSQDSRACLQELGIRVQEEPQHWQQSENQPFSLVHIPRMAPTFSGDRKENVELYVRACKFYLNSYVTVSSEKQLNEVRAMQLYSGLAGQARKFMDTQPQSVTDDFEQAATALRSHFPWTPIKVERDDIVQGIFLLKQSDYQSFESYVEDAAKFRPFVEGQDLDTLCKRWAMGLKDEISAKIALVKISSWKAKGTLDFDRVIESAKAASEWKRLKNTY